MPGHGKGLLFPAAGTLVRRLNRRSTEVANILDAWTCRVDGALQEALWAALEPSAAPLHAMLGALGDGHPLARTVERLRTEPARELSLAQAVRLDGFDTLFVELTGECNERCAHCYAAADANIGPRLGRDLCAAVLQDAAALGFRRVQLTGGEPLLCEFLPELVARVEALEIPVCEIYTNGLLLNEPLLALLRARRCCLAFSFYSLDAACHDAITRTPGSQAKTARAIARALEAGLTVRVSIIVMEQNARTVEQTVGYLRELGVRDVGVTGARPVGRGSLYRGRIDPGTTPVEAAQAVRPDAGDCAADVQLGKLCVTYEGLVVPCIFNRQDVLGDLRQRSLRQIAADPWPLARDTRGSEAWLEGGRERLQCTSCQLTAYALRAAADQA